MFHVEHAPKKSKRMLDFSNFLARGRQCQNEVEKQWCCLRHYKCKSENCQVFFAGVGKIIYNLHSLLRQSAKSKIDLQKPRAILSAKATHVKCFCGVWPN